MVRDQCHGARAEPATCLSKAFSREPLVRRKKWRAASSGGAQAGSPGGQEACHLACRVCPPEQSRSLARVRRARWTRQLGRQRPQSPSAGGRGRCWSGGGSRAPAHHHYCSAASHNPSFQLTTTAELTFQPEVATPLSLRCGSPVALRGQTIDLSG